MNEIKLTSYVTNVVRVQGEDDEPTALVMITSEGETRETLCLGDPFIKGCEYFCKEHKKVVATIDVDSNELLSVTTLGVA